MLLCRAAARRKQRQQEGKVPFCVLGWRRDGQIARGRHERGSDFAAIHPAELCRGGMRPRPVEGLPLFAVLPLRGTKPSPCPRCQQHPADSTDSAQRGCSALSQKSNFQRFCSTPAISWPYNPPRRHQQFQQIKGVSPAPSP